MSTRGKLIVIEGGDGAGKATQTQLLVERLRSDGIIVETLSFPNYTNNTFGALIREFLDGKRGDFMKLDSHLVSTLFLADQFESKQMLVDWIAEGRTVILDRYVSANMIHQTARLTDKEERKELIGWIERAGYEIFGLPKPDLVLYLKIPAVTRQVLLSEQHSKRQHKADLAEADIHHQEQVDECAELVASSNQTWKVLECMNRNILKTMEEINDEVYKSVCVILK